MGTSFSFIRPLLFTSEFLHSYSKLISLNDDFILLNKEDFLTFHNNIENEVIFEMFLNLCKGNENIGSNYLAAANKHQN